MTDRTLRNALAYAALGFKLFPAVFKNGKHQGLADWGTMSTTDPVKIKMWASKHPYCYFCVALQQSGFTVLDIDNKNDKHGTVSLNRLEQLYSELPSTRVIQTPSGGYHYYFKGASSFTVGKLGQGLDTPIMVPLPGSEVKGKGTYKLTANVDIRPLPFWLSTLIGKPRDPYAIEAEVHVPLDTEYNVSRAVEYLLTEAPAAIEGDGGDLGTLQVIYWLREYGISKEKAFELLTDHWNRRCSPAWSPEDLQIKVDNAYRYAQNPIGKRTIEYEDFIFDEQEAAGSGVKSLNDMRGDPKPRIWVVQDWIPEGEVGAFYGKGGLYKSRTAIHLGLHIASGTDVWGLKVIQPMPVLYVPCEDDENEVHRRVNSIMTHKSYALTMSYDVPFYSMSRAACTSVIAKLNRRTGNLTKGKFYSILEETIVQLFKGEKGLLILDTMTDIFKVEMNDPMISSECVKGVLAQLAKRLNITIMVVSHPSKTGIATGTLDSGSPGWLNSFRYMMAMTPHANTSLKGYCCLQMVKANYAELPPEPLILKYNKGVLLLEDVDNIIDELKEHNKLALIAAIQKYQATNPVSLDARAGNKLKDLVVLDTSRQPLSFIEKVILTNELIAAEIIKEVKGKSRKNGLYIVEGPQID